MNRYFLVSLTLILSGTAFVQKVGANNDTAIDLIHAEMKMPADSVTVARTKATPNKVVLTLPVDIPYSVCVGYSTTDVYSQDASCGYSQIYHRVCDSNGDNCETRIENVANSCYHPVTHCSETEIRHAKKLKKLRLQFIDLPVLSGDQKDVFTIDARQSQSGSSNASFEVTDVKTSAEYEIKVNNFLNRAKIKRK